MWENAQVILENVAEDKLETDLNDDVKVVSFIVLLGEHGINRITGLGLLLVL